MSLSFRKIVFTGDFLRPNVTGDSPTQHNNIRWLQNLVSTQIRMSTELPQFVLSWGRGAIKDGQLTLADIRAIYGSFGLAISLDNWAQIYGCDSLPQQFDALLHYFLDESLVVAFEFPPYLEKFCERNSIPYIAATIHPIRFLDDIFLGFKSNIPLIQSRLFERRIDENLIKIVAGVQRASAARSMEEHLKPNSALFVMQTWYDQSQISDGKFVSAERYLDEIINLGRSYEEILVKEHPLAANPATTLMAACIPNLRMISGNIYGYLSVPEVSLLGTLSSSVGMEAPYFGVPALFLLREPLRTRRTAEDPLDGYIGILDDFLNPDFWRYILETVHDVTRFDNIRVPGKPNRLRISLRSFWNFNQIDTDIATGLNLGR